MTVGLLSFVNPSAFNGGKSQVNLNFLGYGDHVFLNIMKEAPAWTAQNNDSVPVTPDLLDVNGWLTSTAFISAHGGVKFTATIPSQSDRPGNYCVTWDGTGTIVAGGGGSQLGSASFTASIAGNVMTVTSPTGTLIPGQLVSTTGVAPYTIIMSQLSGSAGGAGNYVVSVSQSLASRSMTSSGGSNSSSGGANAGFFSCTMAGSNFFFQITGIGSSSNYISNVKIFHVDDAALILSGNVFGTKFKQRIAEARFGVIRFLNWQKGNTSNITNWASRKPLSYAFYGGYELRPTLYAGTTTNVGNAYSVAAPASWPGLVDKAMVHIVFNTSATQSGTCSLNVGGTGAINILSEYSDPLSVAGNSYPIGGTYQSLATLVYDADLNAWIKQGGDVAIGNAGIDNGVPPELMVQLCREVGAHPYFITPPLAIDPATDYMPSLAAYCRSNGPSWMIPRIEGPNELWNTHGGFYQTTYAKNKATAYGWGADYHNWYGKIISVLGQAISVVYGGDRTKYQLLCGVQTGTGDTSGGASGSNARLASTKYLGATPQAPLSGSWGTITFSATAGVADAKLWVTHVCCAQYIGPSLKDTTTGSPNEQQLAANFAGKAFVASITSGVMNVTALNASTSAAFAVGDTIFGTQIFAVGGAVPAGVTITSFGTGTGGLGTYNLSSAITVASQNMTAATDLTAPVTYADTCNSGSGAFTVANCLTLYTNWKAWAQGFSINKMCGYEGGYSSDYTNANGNALVDMLKSASKLDANLSAFTTTNYNNFVGLTGGGFVSEFPSCFQLSGNPNLFGYSTDAWSVMEDIYQSPNPPQWPAIVAFNH